MRRGGGGWIGGMMDDKWMTLKEIWEKYFPNREVCPLCHGEKVINMPLWKRTDYFTYSFLRVVCWRCDGRGWIKKYAHQD
jgi:hypothetical protein